MIRQKGFTVIEAVLILVAIGILTGVGYIVYQKRIVASNNPTSPQTLERLKNEDSYYQAQVYVSASDEERAKSADSSPSLKKVTDDSQLCGAGTYQVIDDNGNVVGCVHGGE